MFFGTAGVACCVPFGFGELGLGRRGELRSVLVSPVGLWCGRLGEARLG